MTAAETEASPPGNKAMIWEIFSLLMLTASELVMGCTSPDFYENYSWLSDGHQICQAGRNLAAFMLFNVSAC